MHGTGNSRKLIEGMLTPSCGRQTALGIFRFAVDQWAYAINHTFCYFKFVPGSLLFERCLRS